jgi:hypothetical protein
MGLLKNFYHAMPARKIYDPNIDDRTRTIAVKMPESEIKEFLILSRAYREPTPSSFLRKLIRECIAAHRLPDKKLP